MEYTAGAGTARCAEADAGATRGATWCRHLFIGRASPPCSPACTCTVFGLWSLTFGLTGRIIAPPTPLPLADAARDLGELGGASWCTASPEPRRTIPTDG